MESDPPKVVVVRSPFIMIPPVCEAVVQNTPVAVGLNAAILSVLQAVEVYDPLAIATMLAPDEEK